MTASGADAADARRGDRCGALPTDEHPLRLEVELQLANPTARNATLTSGRQKAKHGPWLQSA